MKITMVWFKMIHIHILTIQQTFKMIVLKRKNMQNVYVQKISRNSRNLTAVSIENETGSGLKGLLLIKFIHLVIVK